MGRKREPRKGLIGFIGRWFRRFRRLAVLGGVGAAGYKWWQGRSGGASRGSDLGDGGGGGGSGRRAPVGGPRSPSPLKATATPEPEPEPVSAVAGPNASTNGSGVTDNRDAEDANGDTSGVLATVHPLASTATEQVPWVEPAADGSCPPSHPVKANDNSGIYHLPGGRFYDRTEPERCYVNAAAAEADGYRPAKA
jgi:hypothetical protein